MAQRALIARAGRGLLDGVALLLRGAGALFAAFATLFLTLLSYHDTEDGAEDNDEALPDGMSPLEREHIARSEGWNSW